MKKIEVLIYAVMVALAGVSCSKENNERGFVCGDSYEKVIKLSRASGKLFLTDSLAPGIEDFEATYFIKYEGEINGIGRLPLRACNGILNLTPGLSMYDTLHVKFDGKVAVFNDTPNADAFFMDIELSSISEQ